MEKKAVLVVSFGTSYLEALEKSIVPTEQAIADALPDRVLRRAFTSGMILRKLEQRDGFIIPTVPVALEQLLQDGYTDVIIQATHIINGDEYDKLCAQAEQVRHQFKRFAVGTPLLTKIDDYQTVATVLARELPPMLPDVAQVFMGHGSAHHANAAYALLEYCIHDLGREDIHIGTVEGYPALPQVLRRLKERETKRVTLRPLMLVAGDHARNDLAGEDADSWQNLLRRAGYEVCCDLRSLGESAGIRALFSAHAQTMEGVS